MHHSPMAGNGAHAQEHDRFVWPVVQRHVANLWRLRSVLSEYIPVEQHVYALYLPAKVRAFIDFLLARFSPDPYWDHD